MANVPKTHIHTHTSTPGDAKMFGRGKEKWKNGKGEPKLLNLHSFTQTHTQ